MTPEQIIQSRIAQAQRGPASTPYDLAVPLVVATAVLTQTLIPSLAALNAVAPLAGLLAAAFIEDDGEMQDRLPALG